MDFLGVRAKYAPPEPVMPTYSAPASINNRFADCVFGLIKLAASSKSLIKLSFNSAKLLFFRALMIVSLIAALEPFRFSLSNAQNIVWLTSDNSWRLWLLACNYFPILVSFAPCGYSASFRVKHIGHVAPIVFAILDFWAVISTPSIYTKFLSRMPRQPNPPSPAITGMRFFILRSAAGYQSRFL